MVSFTGLDWPTWMFVVAVIVTILLAVFIRTLGLLLLGLVIVTGITWHMSHWFWLLWVFWIVFVVSIIAFLFSFVNWHAWHVARYGSYVVSGIAALMLVMAGLSALPDMGSASSARNAIAPNPTVTSTQTVTAPPVTITQSPSSTVNANTVINELVGKGKPFEAMKGHLKVGSDQVDFRANTEERGIAAFSTKTLKTQRDVAQFLAGSSDRSKLTKERVVSAIKPYGADEVSRALDGSGYFPVQATVAAQILGTTYFHNGKVLEMGSWRTVGPNDIFWLFMTKDGKIVYDAAIRADCANVHLTAVRPIVPGTPPAPSVECVENCQPVKPPECTHNCGYTPPPCTHNCGYTPPPCKPKKCLTPKDPSKDPQAQGNVPTQGTKDHPSDDNSAEVSQPPQTPVDTGNGIPSGSTPRVTPAPATSSTTHVSGPSVPQPTASATTASPVSSSPTASGTVAPHGP